MADDGCDDKGGSSDSAATAAGDSAPTPAADDVLELSLENKKEMASEDETAQSSGAAARGGGDVVVGDDDVVVGDDDSDSRGGDAADNGETGGTDGAADKPAEDSSSGTRRSRAKKPTDGKGGPIVIDASDHVAGRLSSVVAKMLLQGNRVSIVNCERIMISGSRSNIIGEYRKFLKINSIINPKHGPVHYRRPDTVITKMIRGMLPFEKKPSGKTAHKRLRAYVGSPKDLKPFRKTRLEGAMIRRPASTYTTMGELCRVVGWVE